MSIRLRLTLWYGGVLALVLVVAGVIVWLLIGDSLRASLDQALQVQVTDVRAGFDEDENVSLDVRDPARPGIFTVVYDPSETLQRGTPSAPALPSVPPIGVSETTIDGRRYALYAETASDGSVIVAGETLAEVERAVDGLSRLMGSVAVGAVFVALVVGWWLAGRALAPTAALARQLSAIGVGELGRRVEAPRSADEVGRLATAINLMLARIDDGVHRQRAFVTAASHDLRTPIAALRTELELALRGHATRVELHDAVENAHADAVRLGNLANDLLALAESEPGGREVVRRPVSIEELVEECAADQSAVATAQGVKVAVHAPSTEVVIDRSRIEQAIRNLLANAIRHSPSGSVVEVNARVESSLPSAGTQAAAAKRTLTVEVLDRGPGVADEIRSSLFLPFAARSGDGHSGLGLATAAAAVRAHGGAIRYTDRAGGGAQFAFTVPA
jgi:two-component system OmpR family sensor kinase